MKLYLCRIPCFAGFGEITEHSKVNVDFVHHDESAPFFRFSLKINSGVARFIIYLRTFIVMILQSFSQAKIAKSIVRSNPVKMINLYLWKFPSHVKPCKPMRFIQKRIYSDNNVSVAIGSSGYLANQSSLVPSSQNPYKLSNLRVVIKTLFKAAVG